MYKILISGYYGFHNIGDEAVLRCVTEQVRSVAPEVELTILSNDPEDTAEKYRVHSIPRMNPWKVLRALWRTDLLISGGGSLLQDVTGRFSILYYLSIILLALLFRKPVYIYSQGIGPLRGKLNRRLTGWILKRVHAIAVRDAQSARLLEQIGVPASQITVTTDPVLRLEKTDDARGRAILERFGVRPDSGRMLVGWAVKAGDEAFLEEIARSIRYLKQTYQADSVLIPFHFEQDAKCIHQLQALLGEEAYYITEKQLIDEMLSIIGNLDLLVGVRLHSLIYAAVCGVPMIGISYDPKIDAFLSSISQKSVSDIQHFSLEKFAPWVKTTLENRETIVRETERRVELLRGRLDKHDQVISELVNPVAQPPKKGKSGILASIGSVMLITILSKVFGILRESVQASVFGSADVFYASYNKTIYLFTTAAYAMCIAAVPIITKAMERGRKEGERVANNLTTFCLILTAAITALWELLTLTPAASFLFGTDSAVLPYVRIMALSLPVIVCAYLMVALFQSLDHFALQGSMSLPHSVFLIGYLLLFGQQDALKTYAWLVCVAWVLQFAMCLPYAVKERYLYRPVLDWKQRYVGAFLKTSVVTIVTSSIYLLCYLLDTSTAARLGAGTTSAFYYADKLFTPLTTTFIYSISAVLFPRLNREYVHSDPRDYKRYVWGVTSSTLIVVFPVCVLLMVFGGPILKVLFESGAFTPEATAYTTKIFTMYALGMAGFSVMDLLSKSFFSMNRTSVPLLISIGTVALNFLLNHFFHGSGEIIALTTSFAMTAGAVVCLVVMFRGEGIVDGKPLVKSLAVSLAAGGVAWLLTDRFVSMGDGKLTLIVKCCAIGVVFLAVFLAGSFLVRLDAVTNLLKRRKE